MYAIIGANGYLGSYLIKAILEETDENIVGTEIDLTGLADTDRLHWELCNVTDPTSVTRLLDILKKHENVKIIYLAAYHHPDKVQQNPELAWNINVTCLSAFINKARFASRIFYASTDSVYGDSINGHHFVETDALNPVNVYGHNKCAAEAILVHAGFNIVRFPFLISPGLTKKHFYDIIADSIKAGKPFEMYVDSYRSSLSFENAGRLLIRLMELPEQAPSIVNVCGDRDLSKYDVGLMVADQCGVSRDLIVPISITKAKENFETARAETTLMDNSLCKKLLGLKFIDIFDMPR